MPMPKVKVRNLTSPRSNREVANQFIINVGGVQYFQSYDSIIGMWTNEGITLDETYWAYSTTTAKYRNQWLDLDTKETKKRIASGEIKMADLN